MDWDKFTFDFQLDLHGLMPSLISVEAHRGSASNLLLPADWSAQLDRLNRIRALHGTTALEGNPLSEAEVSQQIDIVDRPEIHVTTKATKEQRQIRNAGRAQSWVRERFIPNCPPINNEDILYMHKSITELSDESNNSPGQLRTFPVVVGSPEFGGVHRGAPHDNLSRLMD